MASYSVKRFEPETVLEEGRIERGTVGFKTPKRVTYGVVDEHGKVIKTENPLTHLMQYELYPQKHTAESVADSLRKKR